MHRLQEELDLIRRFEEQIESDPCGGSEVAIGRRARQLRQVEIVAQLNRLREDLQGQGSGQ
jgi:hypothetical protein